MDREKVMSWLEGLAEDDWRSYHSDSEVSNIAKSALALLEEQEHKDRMFHALEDDWKRLKELLKEQEETIYKLQKELNYWQRRGRAVKWE